MKPIKAIPIGEGNHIYHHVESGRQFGRIVAGIGFPGRLPGYSCILGESRVEDRGLRQHHVDLIAEFESPSTRDLLRGLSDLEGAYDAQQVYGVPDEADMISLCRWNGEREQRSNDFTIAIARPPFAENDRLEPFIQLLRDCLQPGQKALHLGEGSILSQRLLELPPAAEIQGLRGKDHPAVAAVGSALMALSICRPMRKKLQTSYLSDEDFIHFNGL